MKSVLINSSVILLLCVLLASAISCKKDSAIIEKIVRDTIVIKEPVLSQPTINYVRTFPVITATTISATKIVRVDGIRATNEDAFSDCPEFKFAGYFRINSKIGNRLTFNFSAQDSIVTMKCDNTNILIDSFYTKDGHAVSFLIRAKNDTIRDISTRFTFQTVSNKIIVSNLVDIVGEINTKCFGTAFWATRYYRILNGTFDKAVSKAIEIDSNYIPKRGDIIAFEGAHYGTVYSDPIVLPKTRYNKPYNEYYFELYEMNAKCTGALSMKVNRVLSYDIAGTFFSYNVDRGEPLYYYRNIQ